MKRESLITKLVAFMLCVMMVVGCLPVGVFAAENDWEAPDIDVAGPGFDPEQPIIPEWAWNEAHTEATATVNVPAGLTCYYETSRLAGMIMTINDGEGVVCTGNNWTPYKWSITNDGEAAADYALKIAYPVGTQSNPAVAVLGDNTAEIEAGNNQGYFWNYTAEKAGDLVFTFSSDNNQWMYAINNKTTGAYGDAQWSDSDPVVNPATVTVAEGEVLEIIVNTYDSANMWGNPAGTVTFNMEYKEEVHEHVWSDWTVITEPSNTTEGLKERTCGCGETEQKVMPVVLKLRWTSLLLSSNISIVFETSKIVYESYDDIYVVFQFRGEESIAYAEGLNADGYLAFAFNGVASNWMAEEVVATIYGTYEGELVTGASTTYSVKAYCTQRLNSTKASDAEKTMLVDLLNYGAAAQNFTNYKTNNLVNKDLTEEQQAYGTSTIPAMESSQNSKYVTIDNPTAKFTAVSLILDSAIVAQLCFTVPDSVDQYQIKVEYPRGPVFFEAAECNFDTTYNEYQFNFDGLYANEMRELFYVTIYKDGVAVSNTFQYSIESFVAKQYGKAGKELQSAMILAMLRYGDSVERVFG